MKKSEKNTNENTQVYTRGHYIKRLCLLMGFLIIGIAYTVQNGESALMAYAIPAVLSGWWTLSKSFNVGLSPYMLIVKLFLSVMVGAFAFPYQIVKSIIGIVKTSKKTNDNEITVEVE